MQQIQNLLVAVVEMWKDVLERGDGAHGPTWRWLKGFTEDKALKSVADNIEGTEKDIAGIMKS